MDATTDISANKIVHEEIPNMLISKEEEKILQKEIELTSHQLVDDERPSKKEAEVVQPGGMSSKEEHEAPFSDEKLENEIVITEVLINEESKCDELKLTITLDANKMEDTINSCVVSDDIQNITQSCSKDSDTIACECHAAAGEDIPDVRQALQSSPEILECNKSNDINIVQNKYANGHANNHAIKQTEEVSADNDKVQVNDSSLQKKENGMSSLNIIAMEYEDIGSDVEEIRADSTNENQHTIQTQNLQQYRTIEGSLSCEEIDSEDDSDSSTDDSSTSSSSSTSSDSSSSSSSSSSDSDYSDFAHIVHEKNESKVNTIKKKKRIQNELDDLPPIEDLKISVPEVLCNILGKIEKIVEQLVIVKPKPSEPTLNLDTVLFLNKGTKALGQIFDVFGSVKEPYYCVRFNDAKHIKDNDIKVDMQVYYCPNSEHTSLVFMHELIKMKGCDGVGDDEAPVFSDDEEEQAYYEKLKKKNKKKVLYSDKNAKKRQRMNSHDNTAIAWQSNHPWNRNRNVTSQKYNQKRQPNWSGDSHFNFTQEGAYSYNETWQQYPYQNNPYCNPWQPVPQNMYDPMTNRPYAEYRTSCGRPHSSQYGTSNNFDGTHQYYQGMNYHHHMLYSPSVCVNTPSYPTWQPPVPMTNTHTHWSPPVSSSSLNTMDAETVNPNSSK